MISLFSSLSCLLLLTLPTVFSCQIWYCFGLAFLNRIQLDLSLYLHAALKCNSIVHSFDLWSLGGTSAFDPSVIHPSFLGPGLEVGELDILQLLRTWAIIRMASLQHLFLLTFRKDDFHINNTFPLVQLDFVKLLPHQKYLQSFSLTQECNQKCQQEQHYQQNIFKLTVIYKHHYFIMQNNTSDVFQNWIRYLRYFLAFLFLKQWNSFYQGPLTKKPNIFKKIERISLIGLEWGPELDPFSVLWTLKPLNKILRALHSTV